MKPALLLLALLGTVCPAGSRERSRPCITFILGEDEDPSLPMYRLAEAFFRQDPLERTDQVVRDARSLKAVADHLRRHAPGDGRPWGVINLVVHGNAQGLLDVPLAPGGPKATPDSLSAALSDPAWQALPDAVVDEASEIRIHGCSVGRDIRLLERLSRLFGGQDPRRPLVRASRFNTSFQGTPSRPGARRLCESWTVGFRPGERPSDPELVARFRSLDPPRDLDIAGALTRRNARFPGDSFSYESSASFSWTLIYPRSAQLPVFHSRPEAGLWLRSQQTFRNRLLACGMGVEQLYWEVTPTRQVVAGIEHPALAALGLGRTLHVLRALPDACGRAWDDARWFTSAR